MAFLEGKLQPIDLLAALQARRQFEESQRGNAERERQQQLQNELLKQQIQKNEDVRGLALGQGGFPYTSAMSNSASIGYPEYRLNQERQLALSQLTGQPLPNQGITGYGGGGRYGGMGGGQDAVAPSGMNYIGPDHSAAPDVTTAAQNLGNVMAGVREPGPSSITDLLAAEQGNQAGMGSLVNQFESKNVPYYLADSGMQGKIESVRDTANIPTPVQDAVGKINQAKKDAADLYVAGGDKPPQGMFTDAEMTKLVGKRQEADAARKGGGVVNTTVIKTDPAFAGLSQAAQKAVDSDPKIKEILKGRGTAEDVILYLISTYGKK
jgi:hypothetical protein